MSVRAGPANAALRPFRSEREGADRGFASSIVGDLRHAVSRYPADRGLAALVRGLTQRSPVFAGPWATAAVAEHTSDREIIEHPEVGEIVLDCDVLVVPGAELRIVTYTAAAGGGDAGKLDLLRVTGGQGASAAAPP